MHDPAVKLALTLSILLGGFLAVLAYRSKPADAPSTDPTLPELAAIRNRRPAERALTTITPSDDACAAVRPQEAEPASARTPTVLTPLDNPPSVPALSSKYPGDGRAGSLGWGMPIDPGQTSGQTEPAARIHTIVDGDTLPALAEKYLGSPDKAMEIFKVNREILSDPELLPIGRELKIPE